MKASPNFRPLFLSCISLIVPCLRMLLPLSSALSSVFLCSSSHCLLRQWNVYKTGQRVADFPLHAGCMGPSGFRPVGKLFSLGADSEHILTCAPTSGIVYKEENGSFTNVLSVGNHKNHVVTVDWSPAVDCSTCATASVDGSISVATLFSHV